VGLIVNTRTASAPAAAASNAGNLAGPSGQVVAPSPERARFIGAERVALLYRNGLLVIGATAALAAMIVLIMWPIVSHDVLLWWFAGYACVSAVRGVVLWRYRADAHRNDNARTWQGWAVASSGLAGTTWGIAAVLFFTPEQPDYMLLMTCLYAVVVAVGTQALAPSMQAYLVFSTTMILPLMYKLVFAGGDFYYPLGMLGILYLFASAGFAYNSHRTVMESIVLRFDNMELLVKLREQKVSAEAANVAKSKFLAAASHDLRQPLHALGLFHDALEPHLKPSGQPVLERMRQSISALGGLFDSLLDISRLDAGVVENNPKDMHLPRLIEAMRQEFRRDAEARGIQLLTECQDEVVAADPVILERILRNLLSNAIRYTEQGAVTMRCERAGSQVRIDVADTGIGIPEAQHQKIFSEYHQLHNPERDRTKGLGLGLAIVQRLCRLSGFDLRLRSAPGEGATFSLLVPAGDPSRVSTHSPPSAWNLEGLLVVVIDDERDILDSMGEVLERWGCRTILGDSAAEAIARIKAAGAVPDIVLADYRLRDNRSGIEAIAGIRALFATSIPALLISGDTAPEHLQELRASGLRMLHKPVLPAELRTALHQEVIDRPR
jgi:signal transduction histidine kinase